MQVTGVVSLSSASHHLDSRNSTSSPASRQLPRNGWSSPRAAYQSGVAIVDEEEQNCIALKSLVESTPGFRCLGTYRTLEAARAGILASTPAIVLMNLLLPDGCGIEFTRFLKKTLPQIVVVMATGFDLEDVMTSSLAAGASGFLANPIHPGQFLATLRFAVGQQRRAVDNRNLSAVSPKFFSPRTGRSIDRERTVMELLSEGLLYKEIAHRLEVSVPVVHKVLHRVYRKLGVTNRTQAIKRWQSSEDAAALR